DGERKAARITSDSRVFDFQLPEIKHDGRCEIELTSARHVSGAGPAQIVIHAIADHAPLADIRLPTEVSLFGPKDTVHVPYFSRDDFALESLHLRIDVDSPALRNIALPLPKPSEPVSGVFDLDLAPLGLTVGQWVYLTLVAKDRNEHV